MDWLKTLVLVSLVAGSLAMPAVPAGAEEGHEHWRDVHHDRRDFRHDRKDIHADRKELEKDRAELHKDYGTLRQERSQERC